MRWIAWHPWSGCSPVSPGCLNCFAVPTDGRLSLNGEPLDDLVHQTVRGPVWNGKLRLNEKIIGLPSATRSASCFQVCPHGDPFHENAPDEWVDRIFAEMEACPRHRFIVMTKRAPRMEAYTVKRYAGRSAPPHIDFGVSMERQREADERIAALMKVPSHNRFAVFFSVLGPIDILAVPGVTEKQLASLRYAQIADGPLTVSASPEWAKKVEDDLNSLGVPVTRHVLQQSVAARGF